LLQAEKMASVGQLAAGMAHEINNPLGFVTSNLSSLKNYTDTLLQLVDASRTGRATPADFDKADIDFLREDLGDLFRDSQSGLARVKTLVTQLKNFAQMDKEAWQLADLNANLEATLVVAGGRIQDKAELVRDFGQTPLVPCMAAHINQVAMALLLNAAQALTGPGRITVRTGADTEHVWFEVSDTGCGMSPEVYRRMFEPFFTTRAVGQGMGLGLSVADDIVRAHGGRIEVHSQPGRGSTVRVWLPLNRAAAI
jgi:two-component system NtrC family sensor kinase